MVIVLSRKTPGAWPAHYTEKNMPGQAVSRTQTLLYGLLGSGCAAPSGRGGSSGIISVRCGDFSRRSVRRTRRQNNSLGVRYASLKHVLAVSPETALVRLLTGEITAYAHSDDAPRILVADSSGKTPARRGCTHGSPLGWRGDL